MIKLILLSFLLLFVFLAGTVFLPKKTGSELKPAAISGEKSPESGGPQEINFKAVDGYPLSGSFWRSARQASSAAVILVHQFQSDRHDFDNFVPTLLRAGYHVLAYDTRGFGQSGHGPTQINDFPRDIEGAVNFLKNQPSVDSQKIGVIGASVGANEAFVASGSVAEVKAAVALSPSNTGNRGVLSGLDLTNFWPKNILIASDEKEKADADAIFGFCQEPKTQKVYPGSGHGRDLLKSRQARADVLSFLKERLK